MDEGIGFGMQRVGMTYHLSPRTGQPDEVAVALLFLGPEASNSVKGTGLTAGGDRAAHSDNIGNSPHTLNAYTIHLGEG